MILPTTDPVVLSYSLDDLPSPWPKEIPLEGPDGSPIGTAHRDAAGFNESGELAVLYLIHATAARAPYALEFRS